MIERDEIETYIKDCENRESKLTEWEHGFIQSMRERVDNGHGLTDAMNEKLEQIWERVT